MTCLFGVCECGCRALRFPQSKDRIKLRGRKIRLHWELLMRKIIVLLSVSLSPTICIAGDERGCWTGRKGHLPVERQQKQPSVLVSSTSPCVLYSLLSTPFSSLLSVSACFNFSLCPLEIYLSIYFSLLLSSAFYFSSYHLLLLFPLAFLFVFILSGCAEHCVEIRSATVSLEMDRFGMPGVSGEQKSKCTLASVKPACFCAAAKVQALCVVCLCVHVCMYCIIFWMQLSACLYVKIIKIYCCVSKKKKNSIGDASELVDILAVAFALIGR